MAVNVPDRVLADIRRFAEDAGVDRVVLFGSRARGTSRERSDIDLAVSGGDFDRFYWNIREHAHTLLLFDLVEMDRGISDELASEIRRDGAVIYEKDR